jgi:hypothetical protein
MFRFLVFTFTPLQGLHDKQREMSARPRRRAAAYSELVPAPPSCHSRKGWLRDVSRTAKRAAVNALARIREEAATCDLLTVTS